MRPDIKKLLRDASLPPVHYPVARAGWNGPEEKNAANSPNPFYDQMRKPTTSAEREQQLMQAATPDWRLLLALAGIIALVRSFITAESAAQTAASMAAAHDNVISFPSLPVDSSEQAA